jgi:hypothetical protein
MTKVLKISNSVLIMSLMSFNIDIELINLINKEVGKMSEHYNEEEEYDYENGQLQEEEIVEIQEEYRRRKLIESLIGPSVSTAFHVILIVILAIFIIDKVQDPVADIEITMHDEEEVIIEKLPDVEIPKPELETKDIVTPVITTVPVDEAVTEDSALENTNNEAPSTDDNMVNDAVSDVIVSTSAFASPSVNGGGRKGGKAGLVLKHGGTEEGQTQLMGALWWLKKVQNPDGSWGTAAHASYTGLALLTFLAHGETQTSKHFGATVKKAMQWLAADPIDTKSSHGYPHAIKTYALCEAYAMTGISLLEEKMNACVRVLIDGQQEGGSYNYNYNTDQGRQDLSFAGWNYQALKAAYGAGCEEPGLPEAIYKAIAWLKKNTAGSNQFPYSTKNNTPSSKKAKHTMRAAGALCLQLFGEGATPELKDDLDMIATADLANLNWDKPPKESLYGWYYATQAMFQAGGKHWGPWNRKFQKELKGTQHKEGYWVYPGSYHKGPGDDISQKVYATTLCALMLTVYYRHLPSSKGAIGTRDSVKNKKEKPEGLDLVD